MMAATDPRTAHKAARREELIDATLRVIRREGADAAIEDVAKEVGVTRPILYRYFGDRRGLHLAVAERVAKPLTAELEAALATDAPPREVFTRTVDAYLAFVERDANVYRFVFRDPGLGDEHRAFADHLASRIAAAIADRARRAGADPSVAEPWAYALVGMVHMAGDWWVEHRPMPRAELVRLLVALAWNGMGAAGRRP